MGPMPDFTTPTQLYMVVHTSVQVSHIKMLAVAKRGMLNLGIERTCPGR